MLKSRFVFLCFFEEIRCDFEFFPRKPCSFSVIFDDKSGSCSFDTKFFNGVNKWNTLLQNQLYKGHSFLYRSRCTLIDILEQLRLLFYSFISDIEYFQNYYKQFKMILFIGHSLLFLWELGYYFSYDQMVFHNRIDRQMIIAYYFFFLISYEKSNRNIRRFKYGMKMPYSIIDGFFQTKKQHRFIYRRYFRGTFLGLRKRILGMSDMILNGLLCFRIQRMKMLSMFDVKNKCGVCVISLTYIFLITVRSQLLQYQSFEYPISSKQIEYKHAIRWHQSYFSIVLIQKQEI